MLRRALMVVFAAVLAAGCSSSTSQAPPIPTPTRGPQHIYVGNASGTVRQYTLPLTSSSAPNFSITTTICACTLALDAGGDLALSDAAGNVQIFTAPLSAASAPSAAFTNAGEQAGQIAFTRAGDLIVSTHRDHVNVFTLPFSNAGTRSSTITAPLLNDTAGVAVDAAQTLYVSETGPAAGGTVWSFPPPYGSATTRAAPPAVDPFFGTIAVGPSQLFVTDSIQFSGAIDVYTLPITAASTPAFVLRTPAVHGPAPATGIAVDAAGNLYVATGGNYAALSVYAAPISAASVATTSIGLSPIPYGVAGIAIGP